VPTEEEKRVPTEEEKRDAEARRTVKMKAHRNFRCITMPRVAFLLSLAQTGAPHDLRTVMTRGGWMPR
jgi:hypothetical protein